MSRNEQSEWYFKASVELLQNRMTSQFIVIFIHSVAVQHIKNTSIIFLRGVGIVI